MPLVETFMPSPHLVWQVTLTLLLTAFVQALTTLLLIACLHIASADAGETSGVALAHYELHAYLWLPVIVVATLAVSAVFVWTITRWRTR